MTVTSASSLTSAVSGTNAAVIRVSGTISCSGMIRVGSNKSILGNSGATISGCGLNVSEASNVIIRNITFRGWNDDAITVQYSTRVWIDHNSFTDGNDGARNNHFVSSGSGQAGGSVASIPYSYTLDTASNVKSIVTGSGGAGAGRITV